jgi:hypothetical protein
MKDPIASTSRCPILKARMASLGETHYGFLVDIETGVDDSFQACQFFELKNNTVVAGCLLLRPTVAGPCRRCELPQGNSFSLIRCSQR